MFFDNDDGDEFRQKLKNFVTEKKFIDIILEIDNKEYFCHKLVLCASSLYFETMFSSDFKESNSSKVKLFGISQSGFDAIYHYLYNGHLPLTAENVKDVYIATDMLLYDKLKEETLSYFFHQLNECTCVDYLLFGYKMNLSELMTRAMSVTISNFLSVCTLNENIHEIPYEIFLQIITSKNLKFDDEKEFLRILYWYMKINTLSDLQRHFLLNEIKWGQFEIDEFDNIAQYIDILGDRYEHWKSIVNEHRKGNPNEKMLIEKRYEQKFTSRISKYKYFIGGWTTEVPDGMVISDTISFISNVFAEIPTPICHTAAVIFGNHVIVIGGKSAQSDKNLTIESKVYSLDIRSKSWQKLSPLNKPRWQHLAIAFDNYILVVGGRNENGEIVNWVEKFDIKQNKWSQMKPFLKLTHLRGCCFNNEVYVFGGYFRTPGSLTSDIFCQYNTCNMMNKSGWKNHTIYKYSAHDDEWIKVMNIPNEYKLFGISEMCIYDEKIHIGGYKESRCLVFDPIQKKVYESVRNFDMKFLDPSCVFIPSCIPVNRPPVYNSYVWTNRF